MKGKLFGFALALLAVATIGVVQLQTKAYVDNTRDCDKYAVIYCGAMTPQEANNKYNEASKIFSAMGISKSEISGAFKAGIVYQNGNVVVDGKVVATNARMAARNLGGTPIAGTNAGIMSVSKMGSAQTAMVKFDQNGRFKFAIMKPCGNPVTATPTQPKPVAHCDGLAVNKIERTKFRFTGNASAKHGAKINAYVFTVTKGGKTVKTIKVNSSKTSASTTYTNATAGDYKVRVTVKTSEGEKTNADCVKPFTVQEKPEAFCKSLTVATISDTKFSFTAKASTFRSQVTGYIFRVYKDGTKIEEKSFATNSLTKTMNYTQTEAGDYTVRAIVKTTLGNKTGDNCVKPFSVTPPEEHPGVKVDKTVSNDGETYQEHVLVGTDVEYTYKLVVTNTGDVDLTNVEVTDTPEAGVTLNETQAVGTVSGNVWTHTIPSLKVGESTEFYLKARVPNYKEGYINNTVCVDATEVPGQPDDCDDATVEVPKKVYVCNPATGEIIKVDETEADNYVPVDSPECQDIVVCNLETKEVVTIKKSEYNANPEMYSTNLADCEEEGMVPVCNPETGKIITVKESEADNYLPVDSDECKEITVCRVSDKKVVTIEKSDFDESIYTTDLSDCEETPVTPPTPQPPVKALPTTGPAEVALQLVGATSLAGAGAYYLLSRRERA